MKKDFAILAHLYVMSVHEEFMGKWINSNPDSAMCIEHVMLYF